MEGSIPGGQRGVEVEGGLLGRRSPQLALILQLSAEERVVSKVDAGGLFRFRRVRRQEVPKRLGRAGHLDGRHADGETSARLTLLLGNSPIEPGDGCRHESGTRSVRSARPYHRRSFTCGPPLAKKLPLIVA